MTLLEALRAMRQKYSTPLSVTYSVAFMALLAFSTWRMYAFFWADPAFHKYLHQAMKMLTLTKFVVITLQALGVFLVIMALERVTRRFDKGMLGWKMFRENIQYLPLKHRYIRYPFVVLLFVSVPFLAGCEEFIFRHGLGEWPTRTLWEAVWRSVLFGLFHCLAGSTIRIALVFSVTGMWLSARYIQSGLIDAVISHATYDYIGLILFLGVWAYKAYKKEPIIV